jgi:Tfp pilus assembly protein PilZ
MNTINEIKKRVDQLTFEQQDKMLSILKDWQQEKTREFKRLKTSSQVDVASDRQLVQSDMRDISACGIYINTHRNFELEEKVRVVFTIPGYEKPFKLTGEIVRVEDHGIAIRFEEITPYFKKILDEAICKSLPGSSGNKD